MDLSFQICSDHHLNSIYIYYKWFGLFVLCHNVYYMCAFNAYVCSYVIVCVESMNFRLIKVTSQISSSVSEYSN